MTAVLAAVETAAAWLVQPCTACTCPKAAVRQLDPDPDCPGLHPLADGCLAQSHVAARLALRDAGVHVPDGSRSWLRRMAIAMLSDLLEVSPTPVTVPASTPGRPPAHLSLVHSSALSQEEAA